jgi:hypothetical protein
MRNCNPLRKPNSLPLKFEGPEAFVTNQFPSLLYSVLMVRDGRQPVPRPTILIAFWLRGESVSSASEPRRGD